MMVVMESFRDSNANSTTDSFSLYERYLRSFNVVDSFIEENRETEAAVPSESEGSRQGNIDLSVNKHYEIPESVCRSYTPEIIDKETYVLDSDFCVKIEDTNITSSSVHENSNITGTTADHSHLTDKSDHTDVPVTSEDSKSSGFKQPVFITSTMENSNNAVDSVPLFHGTRPTENIFKLPIRELSFNGTLKHVQSLTPIVDPITALTSKADLVNHDEKSQEHKENVEKHPDQCLELNSNSTVYSNDKHVLEKTDSSEPCSDGHRTEPNESMGDSQYNELSHKQQQVVPNDETSGNWNPEQSYSSFEASFDSGVRSPDMFSENGDEDKPAQEPFWSFLKDFEAYDKRRVRKLEETLQGVLPPPSVTTLKTDVHEMLKKYYCFLPAFTDDTKMPAEANVSTPMKRVSFVQIPTDSEGTSHSTSEQSNETERLIKTEDIKVEIPNEIKNELDISVDKTIEVKLCTETEARETGWPDVLKCRYHDVYYNVTPYSEKLEFLAQRYAERFVGAETDSSVNVYSGGFQSPSSASKRKAMRIKMAQAKSPGRRLSHLARRRQTFCSAATIAEKASTSSKMVLIDKNFFPHRKLINSSERKSPRTRRTPGKKTPARKTPKKTPAKTPKSSSTKKKAMRRLLMDPENITRSQPREIKRALFISPENQKPPPPVPSTSVPTQAMKSRRALFGSPITAETKSMDGTQSDQFLKRKRGLDDDSDNGRSKIAKSLSFGGDNIGTSSSQPHAFSRRASEVFTTKSLEWDETRKKKLLWAVSEALRVHGWRMSSPGFREKASALARLTRRLLALPPHRARLLAPNASTSDTMLKIARQYVFAIIQGRTVDDCFAEEQLKLNNEGNPKVTGYISATAYQQMKARQTTSTASQVKENYDGTVKQEQPRSTSKNILQDKLVNIDSNSNSSSNGMSMIDKVPLFKSNSMPSFEEAAKMRARRQISFDNVDFPKR